MVFECNNCLNSVLLSVFGNSSTYERYLVKNAQQSSLEQFWVGALLLTVVVRLYARCVGEQVRVVPSNARLRKHLQL